MFGRIRASPTPAEWLEMERPPSKLFKDDSLSVYEATLVKLKQGSQRSLSSEHDSSLTTPDPMDFESNGNVSDDSSKFISSCSEQGTRTCCTSSDSSSASSSSSPDQEPKKGKEVSIHFLFSRYSSSHRKQGLPSPCYHNGIVARHSSTSSTDSSSDSEVDQGLKIAV